MQIIPASSAFSCAVVEIKFKWSWSFRCLSCKPTERTKSWKTYY